jgi:hypothetical protein
VSRDYIKAGPLDRGGMIAYITKHYPAIAAASLVRRADISVTGMASTTLRGGHTLWVSALCTQPGQYFLELD